MNKPCEHCLIEIHKYNHSPDEYYAEDKDGFRICLHKKGDENYIGESDVYEEDEYAIEAGDGYDYYESTIHYCPWCGRRLDGDTQ